MTPPIGKVRPRSTGGTDSELAQIKADAEKTYASLVKQGARVVVSRSAGNNGKPIVSLVPPALAGNTDKNLKYDVQVHYHGMHGTVSKPSGSSHLKEQIAASFDRTPPTVFVLPETDNVKMQGSIGPLWKNSVRDTGQTADDGVKGIVGQRGQLTVSAHSLGRDAIDAAVQNGGLKADRVDIEDGFSNNHPEEMKRFGEWMKKNPGVKVRISVGMASKNDIQKQGQMPDDAFEGNYRKDHWGAELKPWKN